MKLCCMGFTNCFTQKHCKTHCLLLSRKGLQRFNWQRNISCRSACLNLYCMLIWSDIINHQQLNSCHTMFGLLLIAKKNSDPPPKKKYMVTKSSEHGELFFKKKELFMEDFPFILILQIQAATCISQWDIWLIHFRSPVHTLIAFSDPSPIAGVTSQSPLW